jgi:hypothetical protein
VKQPDGSVVEVATTVLVEVAAATGMEPTTVLVVADPATVVDVADVAEPTTVVGVAVAAVCSPDDVDVAAKTMRPTATVSTHTTIQYRRDPITQVSRQRDSTNGVRGSGEGDRVVGVRVGHGWDADTSTPLVLLQLPADTDAVGIVSLSADPAQMLVDQVTAAIAIVREGTKG